MRKPLKLAIVGVVAVASAIAQEQAPARRRIMSQVPPTYPELARKMQMIGTVKIRVVIATNGRLKSAQVMGGSPVLAKAATDALDKWRWVPDPRETTELIELDFHP
jgi:TonB family protein